jgi:hypothetical protein
MEGETTTRVRINVTQSSKGIAQLDVTGEAPTVEEARALVRDGMRAGREEAKAAGMKLADEIA